MAVLVTGGARSGKSDFAEAYAARTAGQGVYIATCRPYDDEMAERTALHRAQREAGGMPWRTIEEPLRVAGLLDALADEFAAGDGAPPVVLVDCLTLWLTNLLMTEESGEAEQPLAALQDELVAAAARYPHPLILVTNEVGGGIVPAYPLGRRFRDEAGRLNRRMAEVCSRVFLVTAGIPVELKAAAFKWEDL